MQPTDLTTAAWRTSSYSNTDGGQCVEFADNLPAVTPVRDSKNPHGPALVLPHATWTTFITALKAGLV
ncbi:DUF397 domain-containing protein [Streptomyces sp. DW26H14]|uniref:DUF397 domain-containing protein n=1 Tax=Streptomyces sp. DW26H14 TaxID=3435395 RepID=UPI00403DAC62